MLLLLLEDVRCYKLNIIYRHPLWILMCFLPWALRVFTCNYYSWLSTSTFGFTDSCSCPDVYLIISQTSQPDIGNLIWASLSITEHQEDGQKVEILKMDEVWNLIIFCTVESKKLIADSYQKFKEILNDFYKQSNSSKRLTSADQFILNLPKSSVHSWGKVFWISKCSKDTL